MVAATTGTMTMKADPHQKCSSSAPDTMGPMAPPAPAKPAQVAMARGRSWGGNTVVTMERVAGMTKAAPMPWMPRPRMTIAGVVASPPTTAPTAKMASPPSSAVRRP